MSQDMTIRVGFADENQADTGFTYLFNCDALNSVG